jgi:uncharacterized protein
MKRSLILIAVFIQVFTGVYAQTDTIKTLTKKSYMVPMRDGTKLFTVVYIPTNYSKPAPILMERTPYGADIPVPDDSTLKIEWMPPFIRTLAETGYIFVMQDIRGKFKSEGSFEMTRPLYHLSDKTKTDESTDAYDAIEWLVKNIPNNNGKVGIRGISYGGYLALDASVNPHPALKASSPQASPADMFLGDDFHHNGAFRLSYGFEYSYMVENEKASNSQYPFPQYDLYEWYLKLGPLKNVNDQIYKKKVPSWNNFETHPNYDSFWKKQSKLIHIKTPQLPILHIGGYYDQEDLNGPQAMYTVLEKNDKGNRNYLMLGPWNHGGWAGSRGDSLGKIAFRQNTSDKFLEMQRKWFDYWLKGTGDTGFAEANIFQTGSNQWKSYSTWPPSNVENRNLYLHADGTCDFTKPATKTGTVNYISDPSKPVPYRTRPIEATFGEGSRWNSWHVEDQRFASSRPDVAVFSADSLKEDLTVTGTVKAHLFVSTTASDGDFVVKLIDVFPDKDTNNIIMSGYQFPVTMEVFRGRFRKSFEKPIPFIPNKPEEIVIDLHNIDHTFLKGHKIMVQIQSTWFPIIDRNPQKYIPNIFEAKESDFIKATKTIYCNNQLSTYIELPVVK